MRKRAKKAKFKEVLIFVAGTTPQIITETIYALVSKRPAVYPDEAYIITTARGEKVIRENLIDSGIFEEFCDEYNLDGNLLNDESIVVVKNRRGRFLNDIMLEKENEALGDFISAFIKDKAKDDGARLHCSLAGGRKTMSFYMGSALQFFGRPWDRLYHVLVTPEFESNPGFYYKPRKNKVLKGSGKPLNTKDAEIHLAELPFIRLRDKITFESVSFRDLVKEGQKDIDIAMMQPELSVKLSDRTVQIGEKGTMMSPLHLMVYTAYLKYKLYRCKYPGRRYCLDCTDCFPSILELSTKTALEEMAKDYMIMAPSRVDDLLYKYRDGLPLDVIRQAVSRIKNVIRSVLKDDALSVCYSINTSHRHYAASRHGVRVEKGKIRIE
jgi:CRISPR-associated protein Csx14